MPKKITWLYVLLTSHHPGSLQRNSKTCFRAADRTREADGAGKTVCFK